MKIIDDYDDLEPNAIQSLRLYLLDRPLLPKWHRIMRHRPLETEPIDLTMIRTELDSEYIALDCAGWYFAARDRRCIILESNRLSEKFWPEAHFEPDYHCWHPDYVPPVPVLAYYSAFFKYCELQKFLDFCALWSRFHPKLLIGLDPQKIKFNFLKFKLEDLLRDYLVTSNITVLMAEDFHLVLRIDNR